MAFRFWRRVRIAPGLTLNLSKSGASLSAGPRGAKVTMGSRGRRATVGIPGTGLFYTVKEPGSGRRSASSARSRSSGPPSLPRERLNRGFFKRLVTPAGEKAFIDGCRELTQGHAKAALRHLQQATHLTDAAFLAGFLYLKFEDTNQAIPLLERAAAEYPKLGRIFKKYGLTLSLDLPIAPEIVAHVGPTRRGALLTLVEACQIAGEWDNAFASLQQLRKLEPDDAVVLLSLAELLWEANHGNEKTCRHMVKMTKDTANETPAHTALLLYKARALNGLGMPTAARDALTGALRRTKDRSRDLLLAVRYERALTYASLGQAKRARSDLEKIFAEDPEFEDVATRLKEQGDVDS